MIGLFKVSFLDGASSRCGSYASAYVFGGGGSTTTSLVSAINASWCGSVSGAVSTGVVGWLMLGSVAVDWCGGWCGCGGCCFCPGDESLRCPLDFSNRSFFDTCIFPVGDVERFPREVWESLLGLLLVVVVGDLCRAVVSFFLVV